MKDDKNANMIIYVLYDVICFMHKQRDEQLCKGENITEMDAIINNVQEACSRYLKTTLGEKESGQFLREIKETL